MNIKSPPKNRIGRLMRQIGTIQKLYKQGLSYEDIGKAVGTRNYTICHFVRERGWTRPRAIHKNSFIPQTDLILKLYKERHLSAPKIAQKIGCDSTTVRRLLKNNGITARDYLESNIKKLYDKGLTYKQIGGRLGKDITGICHFVKSRGWTRPVIKRDRSTYRTKANIPENRALVVNLYIKKKLNVTEITHQSVFGFHLVKKNLIQEGVYNA